MQKVREMKDAEGFNALTDTYEDLVKAGVIDPAKVVRSALQNASSIASLLLTTEALICDLPGEEGGAAGRRRGRYGRHGRACTRRTFDAELQDAPHAQQDRATGLL